jgi:hypothetical protein
MDETTLRSRLREAYGELNQLDERREALTDLVRGYEKLIRLNGLPPVENEQNNPTLSLPTPGRQKGTVSMRSAVQQVLREARGEPLHIREVYHRAQALGATSDAKNPVRITDLLIYTLIHRGGLPIQKVAPATYRWIGHENDGKGDDPIPWLVATK